MHVNMENGVSRRTFSTLRSVIMLALSKGAKTINQISTETGINWRTVELHLTYLVGKGLAKEIFNSSYVRIFTLTEEGKKDIVDRFSPLSVNIQDNKIGAKIAKEEVITI
ncbi:MAG: ArsR family transcriptional regulator [Candidatus Woesearchaeota archaeon]